MKKLIKDKKNSYLGLLIILLLIAMIILLSGCSKTETFNSYKQVSDYCYNQNLTESCGLEKCIMLNVAEFNDQIKFSSEKNYYQCKLLECGK